MKSISHITLKHIFFLMLGFAFLTGSAVANHDSELELYPEDASDACVPGRLQVRATVNHVTHQGIMKLELYAEEDDFLEKKGRLRKVRVEALDGPQLICIDVPSPGIYAIAGYHDKDGDRKLDKKWDFTPKEPYGLSNNPKIKKRRFPKFSESAFPVSESGADIIINLVDLRKSKDKNNRKK